MSVLLVLLLAPVARLVAPLCVRSEDATHCECDLEGLFSSQVCMGTSELLVRGSGLNPSGSLSDQQLSSVLLVLTHVTKVTLENVSVSAISLSSLDLQNLDILFILPSPVKDLALVGSHLHTSLLQDSLQSLHRWLLSPLDTFSLLDSSPVEPQCYWASMLRDLRGLDLSGTRVSASGLRSLYNCPSLSFGRLTRVRLRGCGLTSLSDLCGLVDLTPALAELDLSQNQLGGFPCCLQELNTLRLLNLSRCGLTRVGSWWSQSLQVLDLSHNSLEVLTTAPPDLRTLRLSGNRLLRLPPLLLLTQLQELRVEDNQLSTLGVRGDLNLSAAAALLPELRLLRAGGNPYHCDCQLKLSMVLLRERAQDWPQGYQCAAPPGVPPTNLSDWSFKNCTVPPTNHSDWPFKNCTAQGGTLRPLAETAAVLLLCTAALIF